MDCKSRPDMAAGTAFKYFFQPGERPAAGLSRPLVWAYPRCQPRAKAIRGTGAKGSELARAAGPD